MQKAPSRRWCAGGHKFESCIVHQVALRKKMQAKNPHFCADFLRPISFFWSKSEQNKDIRKNSERDFEITQKRCKSTHKMRF